MFPQAPAGCLMTGFKLNERNKSNELNCRVIEQPSNIF